jgi:hypothetical protein
VGGELGLHVMDLALENPSIDALAGAFKTHQFSSTHLVV